MHPYFYSCPLGYLELVPLDRFADNDTQASEGSLQETQIQDTRLNDVGKNHS